MEEGAQVLRAVVMDTDLVTVQKGGERFPPRKEGFSEALGRSRGWAGTGEGKWGKVYIQKEWFVLRKGACHFRH